MGNCVEAAGLVAVKMTMVPAQESRDYCTVPDPGRWDQDVVLVSAGLLGKPKRGVGNLE